MLYLDKTKNEIIPELTGWDSLQSFKNALDRNGVLSERQTYLDSLAESDLETLTEEQAELILSVPQRLTPAQFRLALLHFGKLTQVEDLIANPTTPQDQKILFNFATYFERKNTALNASASALGMTPGEVDEVFRYGSTLNV